MSNDVQLGTGGLRPFRFQSLRGLVEQQQSRRCDGQHDIYVAEVLYVTTEGKVVVVTVCRQCDTVHFHEKQVASPNHTAELLKEKEKQI